MSDAFGKASPTHSSSDYRTEAGTRQVVKQAKLNLSSVEGSL
ncbi:MAG: hypothetical protein RMY36_025795 [Nostoc sp. SerVER01]|nr:hypothetical protein [Nostoc sp. SerVER01]MDZ8025362.1 hypothetical protein [Nostoc sp. DedQUE11]MDZ8082258.1 hypothetical protein [Nostoc sp. DcaGUA01]